MNYAGWEIVKMVSEGTIKDGQEIIAEIDGTKTSMILHVENGLFVSFVSKNGLVNYGFSWFFQPKDGVSFTIGV